MVTKCAWRGGAKVQEDGQYRTKKSVVSLGTLSLGKGEDAEKQTGSNRRWGSGKSPYRI